LLIRSVTWSYFANTEGQNNYYYLYDANTNILFNFEGLHVADTFSARLEPGIVVPAGALNALYTGSSGSAARVYVQGVLIPATAGPPAMQMVLSGRGSPTRPQ
jgi:hypothetical protein